MDVFSKQKRSDIMSKIRGKNNLSTEIALIKLFKEYRIIGWRRNFQLFGRPDLVFPALRIAIFTDGCFWHGHNCRNITPKTNKQFWQKKIADNKKRDKQTARKLRSLGWSVHRIWECQIKKRKISFSLKQRLIHRK
ncbi:very short patch repair endonuclease [Leptospira santarosai]|uniref:very short patch repair endonuclease n=1 Tax=Leptospira santarosai TaxID=28183 RepID=UPI000A7FC1C7|nr:very short patch repair endonuclease [Leptospira santarosai]